jgi:hypothetical protein
MATSGDDDTTQDLSFAYSFGGSAEAPLVSGRILCTYDPRTDARSVQEVLVDRGNAFLAEMCRLFDTAADAGNEIARRLEVMAGALSEATTFLFMEPSGKCVAIFQRGHRLLRELQDLPTAKYGALCSFVQERVQLLQMLVDAHTVLMVEMEEEAEMEARDESNTEESESVKL